MSTPPSKPETPPAGPTVCVCGYDLTGLPVDGDAKCPGCGACATIAPHRAKRGSGDSLLLLLALSPTLFTVGGMFLNGVASLAMVGYALAGISLFLIAPLSAVLYALGKMKDDSSSDRFGISVAAVVICEILNVVLIGLIATVG